MGTIQNAINGAMGAALGSALATEHIVEQSLTKQAEAQEGSLRRGRPRHTLRTRHRENTRRIINQ